MSVPLFEAGYGKRLCRYLCLRQDVVSDCVGTSKQDVVSDCVGTSV